MHVHHGNCQVLGQSNWGKYFQPLRNSSVWQLSATSLQKTIFIRISRVSQLGYLRQGRHISNSEANTELLFLRTSTLVMRMHQYFKKLVIVKVLQYF